MTKKKQTYKDSIEELESIIKRIENGDVDIDELSSLVKRSAQLIKACKAKLRDTEVELDQFLNDQDD
ncbi:MAG: exodeoxyribonuclease VII small subunit [Bacteroidota bacterium]